MHTQTLHAPFEHFESPEGAQHPAEQTPVEFGEEHGLLCLERTVPDEVMRGLEFLADTLGPFKAEVVRPQRGDDWLEALITDPLLAGVRWSESEEFDPTAHDDLEERLENSGRGSAEKLKLPPPSPPRFEAREAAARWLKADVKRVASVFAREVAYAWSLRPGGVPAGVGDEESVDLTVKLELLRKGKCPRFHLDKVMDPGISRCYELSIYVVL